MFKPITTLLLLIISLSALADTSWEAQEVLLQLQELRSEVNRLKQDVAELKQQGVQPKGALPALDFQPAHLNVGSNKSGWVIMEFSDYQCRFCKDFVQKSFDTLKAQLIDSGRVSYHWYGYLLNPQGKSRKAMLASHCVAEQGSVWTYRKHLYQQGLRKLDVLEQVAAQMQLDQNAFKRCLRSERYAQQLQQEQDYAEYLGISVTPSFIVGQVENGQLTNYRTLTGIQTAETFTQALQQLGM